MHISGKILFISTKAQLPIAEHSLHINIEDLMAHDSRIENYEPLYITPPPYQNLQPMILQIASVKELTRLHGVRRYRSR